MTQLNVAYLEVLPYLKKIFARAIETKKYEANIASLVFLFTLLHFASAAITLLHLTVFYKIIAII